MSNSLLKNAYELITSDNVRDKFSKNNQANLVSYEQECLFARQQLEKNEYTLKAAANKPAALQAAILNVAAIGISLNPATSHAYLVPRKPNKDSPMQICLDISFKGLVKLATDLGAIKWAKAELVYENDEFVWNGPNENPTHKADPFSTDRGAIKGGYCIAKLPDDSVMIEVMSIAEIQKVQATSKAQSGPWKTWFEEMAKKTIIKRASKSWPQTENRERLDRAIEVVNEHEGMAYTLEDHARYMKAIKQNDCLEMVKIKQDVSDEAWNALYNSFPKGEITKNKDIVKGLEREGFQRLESASLDLVACIESDDEHGAREILEDIEASRLNIPAQHLGYVELLGGNDVC